MTASIVVGASATPAAVLTPDSAFVQAGDMRIRLNPAGLIFEAIDAQGQPLSEMDVIPLGQGQLVIVDEALTMLLRPDFVDRQRLQFSVSFPRPGKYKTWLTFWNPDVKQQVAFVIDVQ